MVVAEEMTMKWVLVVGLLMTAGPAFADEVPVPTEGGDVTEAVPEPEPAPCHRCVPGEHDDGFSDSNYSNPEGNYMTSAGDVTCCAPGMSQDWAELTGPYFDPGNVPPVAAKVVDSNGGRSSAQPSGGSKSGSRH